MGWRVDHGWAAGNSSELGGSRQKAARDERVEVLSRPGAGEGGQGELGAAAGMFKAALTLRHPHRSNLTFTRLGKPHPAMFNKVFRRTNTRNLVMIRDTPSTDIRGADNVGITSVLVETGGTNMGSLSEGDGPGFR